MKIKNLSKSTTKLLKLKLIKTKIYKKKFTFKNLKIENILHTLKKAFQIIYKYHINKKKILFLNIIFIHKIKNILQDTKHTFLTEIDWSNGKMTNKKLSNPYNLIVILDPLIDKNIKKEIRKAKIPMIILQNKINFFDSLHNYKISGNFLFNKKRTRDNFFLNLLKIVLRKAKRKKIQNKSFKTLKKLL